MSFSVIFPIYRNFSIYRLHIRHVAKSSIFVLLKCKVNEVDIRVKKIVNSFEMIINGDLSTFQIIQNQNFFQISSKEYSYLANLKGENR
jgi:hypothetical protein